MQVEIIEYDQQYAAIFKQLNLEWLDKYSLTEEADLLILNYPKEKIIDTGGMIYLAKVNNIIVGVAALIIKQNNVCELVKMAVTSLFQGKGISKLLLEKCLSKAKELGVTKISLFSNNQLQAAIGLYKKFGFKRVPVENSPFKTCDVQMELSL